jgi:hypothetical protein
MFRGGTYDLILVSSFHSPAVMERAGHFRVYNLPAMMLVLVTKPVVPMLLRPAAHWWRIRGDDAACTVQGELQGNGKANGKARRMARRGEWEGEANGKERRMGRRMARRGEWEGEANGKARRMGRRGEWEGEANGKANGKANGERRNEWREGASCTGA